MLDRFWSCLSLHPLDPLGHDFLLLLHLLYVLPQLHGAVLEYQASFTKLPWNVCVFLYSPVSAALDGLALLVHRLEVLDEPLILLVHVGHVSVGRDLQKDWNDSIPFGESQILDFTNLWRDVDLDEVPGQVCPLAQVRQALQQPL